MIEINGQHLINGQWTSLASHKFVSANPTTDTDNPWAFFEATIDEVNLAAICSQGAFAQYRRTSAEQRASFLEAIATEIENLGSQLVTTSMSETALPQARIEGERGRTCGQLRAFAANLRQPINPVFIDNAQPQRQPLPKADLRLTQIPLGPVVVFGASNFPLAFSTAGGDTASALAAGCPVIVKGHPAHPATTELVSHAINRAIKSTGMPSGVFGMLQSSTPQVAQALVEAPQIKAVGFTGSQKVGEILNKIAQNRACPIPFFGELGSTNPQFILAQLLAEQPAVLATNQVASMLMGHGQFCTSPGLVVVENSTGFEQFISSLTQAITDAAVGTMLTSGIAQAYQAQQSTLAANDKTTLLGQGKSDSGKCQTASALWTVSANDFIQDHSLHHEVFGPSALIVICDSSPQMLAVSEILTGQLTASIHGTTNEIIDAAALIDSVSQQVGRLMFNQMPTGVEVCHAMQHGGPYPASTTPQTTSVGSQAITRFTRPICLQNMPQQILPPQLRDNANAPQVVV
ncbi:MAG: aldehyde dehydrogenase (NADP(+)) [Gammaproteobacteria bacterium]|nr:aldehyde dehydrogenase (NADP(+)) [Gammaproteobacteria bacterium]